MFANMNMKKIVLWLFITMIVSFLIAGSVVVTEGYDKTFFSNTGGIQKKEIDQEKKEINEEKSFAVAGIENIDIHTLDSNIQVLPADSNEIKVHFAGSQTSNKNLPVPELVAEVRGSKLYIEVRHQVKINLSLTFQDGSQRLDVYVPRAYSKSISAGTVSGEMKISGLSLDELFCESTSGDLTLSSVSTKKTDFRTTSGEMKGDGYKGDLAFESVSGSLEVNFAAFDNDIEARSTSGEIEITLPADAQFNVNFQSTSGELETTFPLTVKDLSGEHKTQGSVGSSSKNIRIETLSGSAEIGKQ